MDVGASKELNDLLDFSAVRISGHVLCITASFISRQFNFARVE